MPELNLVPMMDVLMTILTFFIILSMTYTSQKAVNINLPSAEAGATVPEDTPNPLVIGLDTKGQILLKERAIEREQLMAEMRSYLQGNDKGVVILNADKAISYEKVVQLLGQMREIGGDRVSLAIE